MPFIGLIFKIAALQLIKRGGIGLDTLVETILPELANPVVVTDYDGAGWVCATTPAKGGITLGQLLNHSSVLDYWADRKTPSNGASSKKLETGNSDQTSLLDLPLAYTHRYKDGEGVSTFFKLLKGWS
jgi:CubicO group peptidase (beta-lactamase class C family)